LPFSRTVRPNSDITTTNGVRPALAEAARQRHQPLAERAQLVGQPALMVALPDMRVPAAEIGKG
jgi:hypothetical protein